MEALENCQSAAAELLGEANKPIIGLHWPGDKGSCSPGCADMYRRNPELRHRSHDGFRKQKSSWVPPDSGLIYLFVYEATRTAPLHELGSPDVSDRTGPPGGPSGNRKLPGSARSSALRRYRAVRR